MPELCEFFGIAIYMYCERGGKHNKPHIHAEYQDYEIAISLDGEILDGSIPNRELKRIRTWMALHKKELYENWELLFNGNRSYKIAPLI